MLCDSVNVLQNAHELVLVNSPVLISLVGFVDHLLQFFVSHLLTKLMGNSSQIFQSDEGLLLREKDERLFKLRISVALGHFHGHDFFEVGQVDSN